MDWPGGKSQEQTGGTQGVAVSTHLDWLSIGLGHDDCGNDRAQIASGTSQRAIAYTSFVFVSREFHQPDLLLVCVYEYHVVLAQATANAYPIKPLRAAWFHLIPIYGLYWISNGLGNWPAL